MKHTDSFDEARVRAFAMEIYKDQAAVDRFLQRPHLMLEDLTPLQVLRKEGGVQRVINLLGRMAYGGGV